jgi:hypothetical protein
LIPDAIILERYDDPQAKVPMGLYWEQNGLYVWESPCSDSMSDTLARSSVQDFGALEGEFTTRWFHEAAYCEADLRRVYRNLRCDYFDGEILAGGDVNELAFLGSLLWWQNNSNIDGHVLLGYTVAIGSATDWVELCSIRTVYGDWGLCDEITLESTTHAIRYGSSAVELGEPNVVRTIQGKCM